MGRGSSWQGHRLQTQGGSDHQGPQPGGTGAHLDKAPLESKGFRRPQQLAWELRRRPPFSSEALIPLNTSRPNPARGPPRTAWCKSVCRLQNKSMNRGERPWWGLGAAPSGFRLEGAWRSSSQLGQVFGESGFRVSLNRGREDAERALGREGAARMGCWVEAGSRP